MKVSVKNDSNGGIVERKGVLLDNKDGSSKGRRLCKAVLRGQPELGLASDGDRSVMMKGATWTERQGTRR